jgi:hypothetical protein
MDDLFRFTFLRKGSSRADCDAGGCKWRFTRPSAASTVAAKARDHTRETGHATRVTDVRVTVYRPRK